jgi:hypothetical protein
MEKLHYEELHYLKKGKQSLNRPERTLGFQTFEAPRIFRSSAYEDGKVVSLMQRPPLPLQISLAIISVSGRVEPRAKVRPE